MAEWRFGRGWNEDELRRRLTQTLPYSVNFPAFGAGSPEEPSVIPSGQSPAPPVNSLWNRYYSEAIVAIEAPGIPVPGGAFERAWHAVRDYEFSDPGIVTAHFDRGEELLGRTMLLEIRVLGLRYLCGTRVGAVRNRRKGGLTVRGFRYDTLEGHLERGSEWFTLTKNEKTGEVWFRIHASWRPGEFPNWWSRIGFHLLARRYQLAWHRLAYLRLREFTGSTGQKLVPIPSGERLFHTDGAQPLSHELGSDIWALNAPTALARVGLAGTKSKQNKGQLIKGEGIHDSTQSEHQERDSHRGLRSDLRDSKHGGAGGGGELGSLSEGRVGGPSAGPE